MSRRLPIILLALVASLAAAPSAEPLRYDRDVRPILAENCFLCHGPDPNRRKGGLALHERDAAMVELEDGAHAIVPGKPDESELLARIRSTDDDERMPPPKTRKHVGEAQLAVLERWIAEGAVYEPHWSYAPPVRTAAPMPADAAWCRDDIDRFVLARLEREGLRPAAEADRVTLIRRLSADLTGLPPTPGEVDAFVADAAPDAYERLVDRLLVSPRYGERMATWWLDLVRYADSIGYHSDNPRNVQPYRDWVIAAFNRDLPFDRFTRDQLAGDLLPDAGQDERIASGYNRLLQTTEEGGAQAKEYEAKHLADRVRNVSSVWMGATVGCAECHDHKYDPYTARDFYRLGAFFADVQEASVGAREPGMPVYAPADRATADRLAGELAAVEGELKAAAGAALAAERAAWEVRVAAYAAPTLGAWQAVGPFHADTPAAAYATAFPPEAGIDLAAVFDGGLTWKERADWADAAVHELQGDNSAWYLTRTIAVAAEQELRVSLGSDDGFKLWLDGTLVLGKEVYRGVAPDQDAATMRLTPGEHRLLLKVHNGGGGFGFYFRVVGPAPDDVLAALRAQPRAAAQETLVDGYFRDIADELKPLRERRAKLQADIAALEAATPRQLVTTSGPPRTVRIRPRGDWLDDSGEIVTAGVPAFLPQISAEQPTRRDLAGWIVAPGNPMTARVVANRLWKLFYGTGLSKTLDDGGTQGEYPSHPELLDALACDLVADGWSLKRLVRRLVLTSTYRQGSHGARELVERDPYNRLLARQSRWRLDAEFVRDHALAIAGLLSDRVGGESDKPYQPDGYWQHLNFPPREWMADAGERQWRRGLYTWWQRTFLHPSLLAFDAPTREECTAERTRSNTPLAALVLLDDPSYVEAARVLAARILREGGADDDARLTWAYRRALSRAPRDDERAILGALLVKHRSAYAADAAAATALVHVGIAPVPDDLDLGELAAWTSVARGILNLHETITRF